MDLRYILIFRNYTIQFLASITYQMQNYFQVNNYSMSGFVPALVLSSPIVLYVSFWTCMLCCVRTLRYTFYYWHVLLCVVYVSLLYIVFRLSCTSLFHSVYMYDEPT